MEVYLNGAFLQREEAQISPLDRGFLFGDGIYEVTRIVNGKPFRLDDHLARMDEGLAGLGINLPDEVRRKIPGLHTELIERNKLTEGHATVYLQVSRGTAWPRGHAFPDPEVPPTVYMSAAAFTPHTALHASGIDAITVSDVRWMRCNLKTVNLLPNVLATNAAKEAGVGTALMVRDGNLTESPNANVFGVMNGTLYTFPASNYILKGITRTVVTEMAEEFGIPVKDYPIREDLVSKLDELMVTGTTTDIQPIVKLDQTVIGTGKPGPITRKLQQGLLDRFNA